MAYYTSTPGPQYGAQQMANSMYGVKKPTSPYGPGIYYDPLPPPTTNYPTGAQPHETASVLGVPPAAQQQPAARPAIDFSNIDYSNDPILARVRALAEESMGQANADARANRTRLAIGLGDPELVDQLKLGNDVRKQAAENTFGTFQELDRSRDRRDVFDITGQLSDKANLFYSTERGRQLGLSGEQFLRDRNTATNAVQGQLATISQQLLAAKMASQAQIIQAEQDAYSRALQQALYAAGVG